MDPFRQHVFYLLLWRTILVSLVTLVLVVTHCFELKDALLIGANVALLFSLALIVWSEWFGGDHIVWTEAWRRLREHERPAGLAGRAIACECLRGETLRFAKGASVAAAALSVSTLLLAIN